VKFGFGITLRCALRELMLYARWASRRNDDLVGGWALKTQAQAGKK